jgi:glycerol-3-phosphate dehydrogenase (NAD(P)+)
MSVVEEPIIGMIGYGSWATALVALMSSQGRVVHWWLKNEADRQAVIQHHANPRYLPHVRLRTDMLRCSTDLEAVIQQSDLIYLAIPSAYLHNALTDLTPHHWIDKRVISTIKGIETHSHCLISDYFQQTFDFPQTDFLVVSGPSHAEEVSQGAVTYLTVAGIDPIAVELVRRTLSAPYIYTHPSDDVQAIEYIGLLKNCYTLAIGLATGLGYGHNFLAAFVSGCLREMQQYLNQVLPNPQRDISHSVYLGDFLTSAYSANSRNRQLGILVGQGRTVQQALSEMTMVAEGFFATRMLVEFHHLQLPIAKAIYGVFHQDYDARQSIALLEAHLI